MFNLDTFRSKSAEIQNLESHLKFFIFTKIVLHGHSEEL